MTNLEKILYVIPNGIYYTHASSTKNKDGSIELKPNRNLSTKQDFFIHTGYHGLVIKIIGERANLYHAEYKDVPNLCGMGHSLEEALTSLYERLIKTNYYEK